MVTVLVKYLIQMYKHVYRYAIPLDANGRQQQNTHWSDSDDCVVVAVPRVRPPCDTCQYVADITMCRRMVVMVMPW